MHPGSTDAPPAGAFAAADGRDASGCRAHHTPTLREPNQIREEGVRRLHALQCLNALSSQTSHVTTAT